MDNIIHYISCLPDDFSVILDIGTNTGKEIPYLQKKWKNSRIICVEPITTIYNELRVLHPDIEAYNCALYNEDGQFNFYPSAKRGEKIHTGSSSLRQPKEHLAINPDVTFAPPYKVNTLTLDSFCKQYTIDKIDFIWMDVQGTEYDILYNSRIAINAEYIYTESYTNEMYLGQKTRKDLISLLHMFDMVDLQDEYNILFKRKHE